MKIPDNPFPLTDKGIRADLFVGRNDVLTDFATFLNSPARLGANQCWIITGPRGQGKSTLRDELRRLASKDQSVACGDWDWMQKPDGIEFIAHGLYASIAHPAADSRRPITEAAWKLFKSRKLERWLSVINFNLLFTNFDLSKIPRYADRFRDPAMLVRELTTNLLPDISTVVFLIDEISDNADYVEPTRVFSKTISNLVTEGTARPLNLLTILFMQPHDEVRFSSGPGYPDGPRNPWPVQLQDFSRDDLKAVLRAAVYYANSIRYATEVLVECERDKVVEAVVQLAGGIPTLSLGLFHDAYNHMSSRVREGDGDVAVLVAADVLEGQGARKGQAQSRLLQFKDLQLPPKDFRRDKVVLLKHALSNGSLLKAPCEIGDLKKQMQALIGAGVKEHEAIMPLLDALNAQGYTRFDKETGNVAFRGELLRKRLGAVKVA